MVINEKKLTEVLNALLNNVNEDFCEGGCPLFDTCYDSYGECPRCVKVLKEYVKG